MNVRLPDFYLKKKEIKFFFSAYYAISHIVWQTSCQKHNTQFSTFITQKVKRKPSTHKKKQKQEDKN
jgi:hypothetical protein